MSEVNLETLREGRAEIIELLIPGPRGPAGPPGSSHLEDLLDVNVTAKVDNSILYYDQTSEKFVADDINTVVTLTDGGNF